jgi:hypothetical protein
MGVKPRGRSIRPSEPRPPLSLPRSSVGVSCGRSSGPWHDATLEHRRSLPRRSLGARKGRPAAPRRNGRNYSSGGKRKDLTPDLCDPGPL